MEQAVKTLVHLFILFIGVFLLVTILTFGIAVHNAKTVLYSVIDFVEIAGFEPDVIADYADKTHTQIEVTPTADNTIYASGEERERYTVEVTFQHALAWVQLKPTITLKGVTRAVEY